jgi:hypothetical protein
VAVVAMYLRKWWALAVAFKLVRAEWNGQSGGVRGEPVGFVSLIS